MGSHVDELVEALSTAVQRQAVAGTAVVAVDDDAKRFVAIHTQHVRPTDGRQFADVVAIVALDEEFALRASRHRAVDAASARHSTVLRSQLVTIKQLIGRDLYACAVYAGVYP